MADLNAEGEKMGVYKYINNLWKNPKKNMPELMKERLIEFRKEPSTLRIENPTRLDKARKLGYKAKQGYILVRQRVLRGGRKRPNIKKGRRPKHNSQRLDLAISYQVVAEQRAQKKHKNCEVLNSYYVLRDGKYYWYEIILVDKSHPVIVKDKNINWITKPSQKGRVFRGLTSSAKKARGLRNKGKGTEKIRPSKHASHLRKVHRQSKK